MTTENKFRSFYMDTDLLDKALDSCDLGDGYSAKVRRYPHKDVLPYLTHVIEIASVEQLKAENLLLSDDRELYMRHRDILIDALRVVESHNGINTHYPIVYATTKQALRDVGEI